jgi:ribokinase
MTATSAIQPNLNLNLDHGHIETNNLRPRISQHRFFYYLSRHPLPGETLIASNFSTFPGGKGANQAVACARLSRRRILQDASVTVMMAGAVGEDAHGTVLMESLKSYGVDVSEVVRNEARSEFSTTGSTVVMVDQQTGQNRILFSPGANASVRPSRIAEIVKQGPALLIMQLEIPFEAGLQACRTAKAAGIPVLLNPAPAAALPDEVYDGLTHLILNETEIALLAKVSEADLEDMSTVERVAASVLAKGVQNLVVTLGGRGAYYACANGRHGHVPALKVDVVDTTAAGDTFIGMYSVLAVEASSRSEKFNVAAAVRQSIVASSRTVARKGAQVSIPWKDELDPK